MILLKQNESGLLGSPKAIELLKTKDSAQILAVSDSHRNPSLLEEIIRRYGKNCDALVFTGDGISDLITVLENAMDDDELAQCVPQVAAFAQGNGDPGHAVCCFDPTLDENVFFEDRYAHHLKVPHRVILEAAGKKLYITHGHLQGIDFGDELVLAEARMEGASIIVHGHTHVPRQTYDNGSTIINPGSISRPRCGSSPDFAVITIKGSYVDAAFINTRLWKTEKIFSM